MTATHEHGVKDGHGKVRRVPGRCRGSVVDNLGQHRLGQLGEDAAIVQALVVVLVAHRHLVRIAQTNHLQFRKINKFFSTYSGRTKII